MGPSTPRAGYWSAQVHNVSFGSASGSDYPQGYTGMVEVAHVPVIPGDEGRRIADAWSVGYVKALIAAA